MVVVVEAVVEVEDEDEAEEVEVDDTAEEEEADTVDPDLTATVVVEEAEDTRGGNRHGYSTLPVGRSRDFY